MPPHDAPDARTSKVAATTATLAGVAIGSVMVALVEGVRRPSVADLNVAARQKQGAATAAAGRKSPSAGSGLVYTLRRLKDEIVSDRVMSVAGGVTFFTLLALFPAITAIITLFGLVADPAEIAALVAQLSSVLPQGGADIVAEQAKAIAANTDASLSLALIVSTGLALWSANGGTKSILESLNIAYDVRETRGFVRLTLVSLGLTLAGIVFSVVMGAVVAVLPVVLDYLYLGDMAKPLLLWGRWPVIFAALVATLAVVYRWGPDRPDAEWRWITPGALLASGGVCIFSIGFGFYVQNFGSYNETYGSLGAGVALMTWVWLSTAIVMVGAELNAELDRQGRGIGGRGFAVSPGNNQDWQN